MLPIDIESTGGIWVRFFVHLTVVWVDAGTLLVDANWRAHVVGCVAFWTLLTGARRSWWWHQILGVLSKENIQQQMFSQPSFVDDTPETYMWYIISWSPVLVIHIALIFLQARERWCVAHTQELAERSRCFLHTHIQRSNTQELIVLVWNEIIKRSAVIYDEKRNKWFLLLIHRTHPFASSSTWFLN